LLLLLFLVTTTIIPEPNSLAIGESQTVFLGTTSNSIPAWHFLPPSVNVSPPAKIFSDESPITLYLRENREIDSDLQLKIFKTLVSIGYHVIVPINLLNEEEVSVAWSWIKEKAPKSSAYLWGDYVDSR